MSATDDGLDLAIFQSKPYTDEDLMRHLYVGRQMSQIAISELLDCSSATVSKYLDKHGIEKRSASEQISIANGGGRYTVPYAIDDEGTVVWWLSSKDAEQKKVYVSRLLAVAMYGFDAVANMHVHHENEVRWDNRPENIELMDPGEHSSHHHSKVTGLDRLRIAELYENGDIATRPLAAHVDHDITQATVLAIHEEFYGGSDDVE